MSPVRSVVGRRLAFGVWLALAVIACQGPDEYFRNEGNPGVAGNVPPVDAAGMAGNGGPGQGGRGGSISGIGGTTGEADKKGASLLRTDTTGTAVATPVDVDALLRGRSTAKDLALQPGDIIYIPTKNAKSTNPAQILLSAIPLFSLFRR